MKVFVIVLCVLAVALLSYRHQPRVAGEGVQTLDTAEYSVVVNGKIASIAVKSTKARIEVDSASWSGGVAVNYLLEPTESRSMSWCTDLDSDGTFDVRGVHDPKSKTTELAVFSSGNWVIIQSIDKSSLTATKADGSKVKWEPKTGWTPQ